MGKEYLGFRWVPSESIAPERPTPLECDSVASHSSDVTDLAAQLNRNLELGFDVADIAVDELQCAVGERGGAVLVLPHRTETMQEFVTWLHLAGRSEKGIFDRSFKDPDRYHPVDPDVARDRPYLVHGFEPGVEYLNLPPRPARACP